MQKDFDTWNNVKKVLGSVTAPGFSERDVWFCQLGINVGFEQDGDPASFMRPVVVITKFNKEIFWALPLSRTSKIGKFYCHFDFGLGDSTAILSQIRLIDARRLGRKIGEVNESDFANISKKLKELLP